MAGGDIAGIHIGGAAIQVGLVHNAYLVSFSYEIEGRTKSYYSATDY